MISQDAKQQWVKLQANWIATTKEADRIERELVTALKLCHQNGTRPPALEVINDFELARGRALAARVQVDLFVDKLFLGPLPEHSQVHVPGPSQLPSHAQ